MRENPSTVELFIPYIEKRERVTSKLTPQENLASLAQTLEKNQQNGVSSGAPN